MARIRTNTSNKSTSIIWKVAPYIRLSKEDGGDVSVSVINQQKIINEYLAKFSETYELVDYYIDDGFTGTDSNRDSFQRLLKDIETGNVNCVIVKDLSRISRNYWEAGQYLESYFVKFNVRFISLSLPEIDSYKNPESMQSIAVPIISVFNDDFAKQTSLKIRKTFDIKRSRGEFIGAFAPYGYAKSDTNKNCLVIDPDASLIVKDIYHWFVYDGMSKRGITMKLNQLGIPNPTTYKKEKGLKYCRATNNDGLWSTRTITSILKNEIYIGNMVQGRQKVKSYKVHEVVNLPQEEWFIVQDTHEPIIDKATFQKAQSLQEKDTRTAPKNKELSLFAGFLKCADCGKGMRRTSAKGIYYYICGTYKDKSTQSCSKHTIREDILEDAVLKTIQTQIAFVEDIQKIIEDINKLPDLNNKSERLEKALRSKENELNKILLTKDNLYMDWKTNEISHEDYQRMKDTFEKKAKLLKDDIQHIKEEIELCEQGVDNENSYFTSFLKYRNIKKLDRAILVCLVDKILIHEDKHITIEFNFADQHMRIMEFIENNKNKTEQVKSSGKKEKEVHSRLSA